MSVADDYCALNCADASGQRSFLCLHAYVQLLHSDSALTIMRFLSSLLSHFDAKQLTRQSRIVIAKLICILACAGPKTLCNACGVRRVRRNKGRGPHSDPAAAGTRTSLSPDPWSGGDSGGDDQASEPMSRQYDTARTNEPSPLGRRPQRKAAGTKP